jgi:hypothetical protein
MMGRKLIYWVIFSITLTFILIDANAQAPVPGRVTANFQTRTQTNSYSSYADFFSASAPGPLMGPHFRFLPLSTAAYVFENIPYSGNTGSVFGKNQFLYFVSY